MNSFNFREIGRIESCYRDKFGTPRQSGLVKQSLSRLKISSEFQPQDALEGLGGFSHAWLIWVFHQNTNQRYHAKVHPPRLGGASQGVFATRSPHRPNPIGLSLVKIAKIESPYIYFEGADLVDGTPILDLKPYLPEIESKPDAKNGWTSQIETHKPQVVWNAEASEELLKWQKTKQIANLREIIEETLQMDPRPLAYKGFEGQASPYREEHAIRLFDGDIHFAFREKTKIEIFKVMWNLDDFNINKTQGDECLQKT